MPLLHHFSWLIFSGKTFGQFQLREPISSGGMATIYKAYQPELDRVVAIKVLPEFQLSQAGFLGALQDRGAGHRQTRSS